MAPTSVCYKVVIILLLVYFVCVCVCVCGVLCVLIPCYVMYALVSLLVLQVFCLGKERWFACLFSLSVP